VDTPKRFGQVCRCGARRIDAQLGLERTPEEYVGKLVEVFREVRRVLRKDGTLWLNLGDSYVSNPSGRAVEGEIDNHFRTEERPTLNRPHQGAMTLRLPGLKPKDLVGIPWRVAFALQADGWYLRSDIIWSKPNPMPESVTDRPTKSHEYVFLLSKSAKYFFDQEAVREELRNGGRNIRSVWTIATSPFPEAHFATFPPELARRCILAGTSEKGCCAECGTPWERVVATTRTFESGSGRAGNLPKGKNGPMLQGGGATVDIRRGPTISTTTTGWRPGCKGGQGGFQETADCGDPRGGGPSGHRTASDEVARCTVLDPFFGAGTVGLVAESLGRKWIGIELNPKYVAMAERRIRGPLFAEAAR
jgi:DNA modification methylase